MQLRSFNDVDKKQGRLLSPSTASQCRSFPSVGYDAVLEQSTDIKSTQDGRCLEGKGYQT